MNIKLILNDSPIIPKIPRMTPRYQDVKKCITEIFPDVLAEIIALYDYMFVGCQEIVLKDLGYIVFLDVFPDDTILIVTYFNVKIWNQKQHNEPQLIYESATMIRSCTIIYQNLHVKYIAVCGCDHTLKLLDPVTYQTLFILREHNGTIERCYQLSDQKIITCSYDNTLKIWDLGAEVKCILTLSGHTGAVCDCVILPDGKIASCSSDYTIKIWDINIRSRENNESLQCIATLKGHESSVYRVCVIDQQLVSGSNDGMIRTWDLKTYQHELALQGHSNALFCLNSLCDGQIISGSVDHTIRTWNPVTGFCSGVLDKHTGNVSSIIKLSDGRVVSGSSDDTISMLS